MAPRKAGRKKPWQITRADLTDAQWEHMDKVLFPTMRRLKLKIRQRQAEMEAKR